MGCACSKISIRKKDKKLNSIEKKLWKARFEKHTKNKLYVIKEVSFSQEVSFIERV